MLRAVARVLALLAIVLSVGPLAAVDTERLYLSGTGYGDERPWRFRIEQGRRADDGWTTIPVPSQWELEGFGTYRYGRHDGSEGEVGHYRHRFEVPPEWRGRKVRLVFGGVMTDTEARVNGRSAGPPHRGGFTRFSYDVTDLLAYGGFNLLEVRVLERSQDRSVERAEREADYWVFGGVYRPVWLEASPTASIAHVAIDARHDGRWTARVEVDGAVTGDRVTARVRTQGGRTVGAESSARVEEGGGVVGLQGRLAEVEPWSAERPRLYELVLKLQRDGEVLHRTRRRFGFRTFEIRPGVGLFVNDRRILLRGINRHSFWPDSGRTLNDAINRRDAELLKELNVNAVRASHYPPDEAFLDACDELGLYVIDELPGWHDAYSTEVGETLVAEMVRRDVNHPSILMWANGNEGGWNRALDDDFDLHDPQRRPVVYPDEVKEGLETFHYPTYNQIFASLADDTFTSRARAWLKRPRLVLPTEMLHGLYDGGLGSGLESFWRRIRQAPRGAGGFLWAFLDEAVVRTDRDGALDSFGNYAPDGLVGPYREKEASFRTVRRVWSPVQIEAISVAGGFTGGLRLENRFHRIDLSETRYRWLALALPGPMEDEVEELARGEESGPPAAPGATAVLRPAVPTGLSYDALEVTAVGPDGRILDTWTFPTTAAAALRRRWLLEGEATTAPSGAPGSAVGEVSLSSGDRRTRLSADTGDLVELALGDIVVPLSGGPRLTRQPPGSPPISAGVFEGEDRRSFFTTPTPGRPGTVWTLFDSGWLRLDWEYPPIRDAKLDGILLDLPDDWLRSVEWLGRGPDPVWANRLDGPRLDLWRSSLRNDNAGRSARGFYDGVLWMRIHGEDAVLTVVPDDDLFVGVSAPTFPDDARGAVAEIPPPGTLSFLHRISPMGSKFHAGLRLMRPDLWTEPPARRTGFVWFYWQPASTPAADQP